LHKLENDLASCKTEYDLEADLTEILNTCYNQTQTILAWTENFVLLPKSTFFDRREKRIQSLALEKQETKQKLFQKLHGFIITEICSFNINVKKSANFKTTFFYNFQVLPQNLDEPSPYPELLHILDRERN